MSTITLQAKVSVNAEYMEGQIALDAISLAYDLGVILNLTYQGKEFIVTPHMDHKILIDKLGKERK